MLSYNAELIIIALAYVWRAVFKEFIAREKKAQGRKMWDENIS